MKPVTSVSYLHNKAHTHKANGIMKKESPFFINLIQFKLYHKFSFCKKTLKYFYWKKICIVCTVCTVSDSAYECVHLLFIVWPPLRCSVSHILWASEYFIKTETSNYLPDIRQLHSSTIPHLGSWYWAACSSQLFRHNSSQKILSGICWEEVGVIKINSPGALSTNKPYFFFFILQIQTWVR